MGSNYSLLIYHQEDTDIKGYDYNTLNGKRIGVLKRAVQKIERLQEFLTFNNISCELVYYEDTTEYGNCLESGKVDLMLGADVYMQEEAAAKKTAMEGVAEKQKAEEQRWSGSCQPTAPSGGGQPGADSGRDSPPGCRLCSHGR